MDCNKCEYLNITEAEQRRINHGNSIPHFCTKYNKRVIHRASSRQHSSYLYPCEECEKENNNERE
jgi:hypothetical protein